MADFEMPPAGKTSEDMNDITNPIEVAHIAFAQDFIQGENMIQSYVDTDDDGTINVDVYTSDRHLEGGGAFRYRLEYIGPAPEPGEA